MEGGAATSHLSAYTADGSKCTPNHSETVQQHRLSTATLSQAVSVKLEDGNVRAAVHILMSDDSPANPSPESLKELNDKPPPASRTLSDLPAPKPTEYLVSVDENEILHAAVSFPVGLAGGPIGLRTQHICDMLMCREASADFLSTLTGFTILVLSGRCH